MSTDTYRPSAADRAAIVAFMIVGAVMAVVSVVWSISRVTTVLGAGPVTVPVEFVGTETVVDLGGDRVPVAVNTATVTVDTLPAAARVAAVTEALGLLAVVLTVIVCLLLLARATLRGRVFSRGATALVVTASLAGLVGALVLPALGGLVADLTVTELVGPGAHGVVLFAVQPMVIVVAAFAIGIVVTAFAVGARMQRDQEGLV